MAVIARRGWSAILAETKRRCGNLGGSAFSTRLEYFLWASYQQLCLSHHHFELDSSQDLSFAAGDTSKALASDTYIILGVSLLSGSTFLRNLSPEHAPALLTDLALKQAARPAKYTRYGANLYVNCPCDEAYTLRAYYYKQPAAPDFATTGTPVFASDCDEHLIELAVRMVMPALGRPDLGEVNRQLLSEWLAEQPRDPILARPQAERERPATNRMIGGAQG